MHHASCKLLEIFRNLHREIGLLKSEIEQRTTTGHYPFLVDRENLPVVNLTLKGESNLFIGYHPSCINQFQIRPC